MTPIRKLRNLRVREVSLVDRAANPLATVKLAKRDGDDGGNKVSIGKRACDLWEELVTDVAKTGMSRSAAIDALMKTERGRFVFGLAKSAHDGSGQRNLAGAGDHATAEAELQRMRSEHQGKAAARLKAHAEGLRRGDPTLSLSQAYDRAIRDKPAEWQASKPMQPLSHDGNSPVMRGPYQ